MEIENRIIFEDNHIIVVNKKSGELSQGDKTNDVTLPDLIKSYLKKKYNKPGNVYLGIVHRLDRPTSGLLVFAKTSKALSRLNHQFKLRTTKKVKWSIVEKLFKEEIKKPIPKKAKKTKLDEPISVSYTHLRAHET